MKWMDWYNALDKPSWTPSPSTIGLIWQCLYPIIFFSCFFVLTQAIRKKVPWTLVLPFGINLLANLLFSPIFFGLRNLALAWIDILLVWGTIVWMIIASWRHYRWLAVLQLPYLTWVTIATTLQTYITFRNS